MNYSMLNMLAEDVNDTAIANPMIWTGKRSLRKAIKKTAARTATTVAAVLAPLTMIFAR